MASIAHPDWCDRRVHMSDIPWHSVNVGARKAGRPHLVCGEGVVEVGLVQDVDDTDPMVILYVSECQGTCDDDHLSHGDGSMVDLTAEEARWVVSKLSQALSILDGNMATSEATSLVRAA